MHSCTLTQIHTYTHTQTQTQSTSTHQHTQTPTHTNTHTHIAHQYTHTHTQTHHTRHMKYTKNEELRHRVHSHTSKWNCPFRRKLTIESASRFSVNVSNARCLSLSRTCSTPFSGTLSRARATILSLMDFCCSCSVPQLNTLRVQYVYPHQDIGKYRHSDLWTLSRDFALRN